MPRVSSGKVLVTGANGFIARWIVKAFLDAGFIVWGTVRSTSKGEALKELFKTDNFEYIIVEDIANIDSDSFDQSLKDVHVVIHAASPVPSLSTMDPQADPDEFIRPAVDGTTGILKSILRAGKTVERVVILSSVIAVIDSPQSNDPVVYDEEHWASLSLKIAQEEGKKTDNYTKYGASKILSEKAAWDLYTPIKDTVKWDLVVLNPVYVLGPILEPFPTTDLSKVQGPNLYPWFILHGKAVSNVFKFFEFWVDVRDVAEASVKAVTVEEAANHRFIIYSGPLVDQELLDAVHADDHEGEFNSFVKNAPGSEMGDEPRPLKSSFSNKKSREILGIKYRTIRDSAKDLARTVMSRK